MKFLDLCKVYVRSGKGGNGCVSFRREKFIEFGGPDDYEMDFLNLGYEAWLVIYRRCDLKI